MTADETAATGATSPTGEPHPGEIVHDDRIEHRTWTVPAAAVPVSIAWVDIGNGQWRPVVRIEVDGSGDMRRISSFGRDRELLETTIATRR